MLLRNGMKTALAIAVTCLALAIAAFGQKQTVQVSDLKFNVVKATNGKPVRNAAVILHALDKDGSQGGGGINLKTDADGHTSFQGVPYGKLRIQVIAHGFQTYGEDFEIDQPSQEIVIKMKPPADQYSIYGDQDKTKEPEKKQ